MTYNDKNETFLNSCNFTLAPFYAKNTEYSPSDFASAFMGFNRLYSVNWHESNDSEIVYWDEAISEDTQVDRCETCGHHLNEMTEQNKINEYLTFIINSRKSYYRVTKHLSSAEVNLELSREFSERMKNTFSDLELKDIDTILSKIVVDDRIGQSDKENFIRKFKELYSHKVRNSDFSRTLKYVVRFIYLVRNNFFHGAKSSGQVREEDQNQRLIIYSKFLGLINSMLFEILETSYKGKISENSL